MGLPLTSVKPGNVVWTSGTRYTCVLIVTPFENSSCGMMRRDCGLTQTAAETFHALDAIEMIFEVLQSIRPCHDPHKGGNEGDRSFQQRDIRVGDRDACVI